MPAVVCLIYACFFIVVCLMLYACCCMPDVCMLFDCSMPDVVCVLLMAISAFDLVVTTVGGGREIKFNTLNHSVCFEHEDRKKSCVQKKWKQRKRISLVYKLKSQHKTSEKVFIYTKD